MTICQANKSCIVYIVLSFYMLPCFAQNWDIDLLKKINPDNPNSGYWKITSSSAYWLPASGVVATFLSGTIKHDKQLQIKSYQALIGIGVDVIASEIIKVAVNRTRPAYAYPDDITEATPKNSSDHSFPSGHTSLAFNYATTVSLQFKKWYVVVPAYAWAGSVGYSRLYRGKHYPSDVFVGAVLGTASSWLSYKLSEKLFAQK